MPESLQNLNTLETPLSGEEYLRGLKEVYLEDYGIRLTDEEVKAVAKDWDRVLGSFV
jgi:hypothetical protein